jgi:hypothetical protein
MMGKLISGLKTGNEDSPRRQLASWLRVIRIVSCISHGKRIVRVSRIRMVSATLVCRNLVRLID